jgi:short-subunit dehydrogenase
MGIGQSIAHALADAGVSLILFARSEVDGDFISKNA